MAIGRYRDAPSDMDEVEREVAAAQYPEGCLVIGLGLGIVLPVLVAELLLLVTPFLGGVVGYGIGRRLRAYKIRRRHAERATGDDGRD